MIKKVLTFLSAFGLCALLHAQGSGEVLKTGISRDTILIGDQIEWTIDLDLQEGERYFVDNPGEIPVQGVETIKPLSFDTLEMKKGSMKVEGKVILTSFDSGSYYLPQMMAMIARNNGTVDTLLFESPVLEVTTIPIDTATFEPFDIKGQILYPVTFKEIIPWIGGAILVILLILAAIRFIRARKENGSFFGKSVANDPPHIIALRSLEKIRSQKLWQNGKQKLFYTYVTDTLRQYIADRYGISALEQTSAEIIDSLKKEDISEATFNRIKDLFTTADFVKFAKHNASDEENEEAIPTAVRFVNETFMQQMEKDDAQEIAKESE